MGILPVRMAVHCGAADLFHGEYYGPVVGQLARLTEAANAGQILVSEAAGAGGQRIDADGVRLHPLGRHRLRDLGDALALFQLTRSDQPEALEPPRTLDAGRHNLPVQVTSFVGRDAGAAAWGSGRRKAGGGARLVPL